MALSDCIKCWDTPCSCGYEYSNLLPAVRIKKAAVILGITAEDLTDIVQDIIPTQHPGENIVSLPKSDRQCICKGNWRQLVHETTPLYGKTFVDSNNIKYKLFGLVDGINDYYYGVYRIADNSFKLLSCVGNLTGHGYTLIDDNATVTKKLWLVTQPDHMVNYDTYDSFVGVAIDKEHAAKMSPVTNEFSNFAWRAKPDEVTVTYLGEADDSLTLGQIVSASYNAG